MGWLNFLTIRSFSTNKSPSNDSSLEPVLKAQAYDATVASHPPIVGTYPVAGNGQNILEQFQKSHPQFMNTSAPPPLVPRVRAESVGRPKTAPSTQLLEEVLRPKSEHGAQAKPKIELREPLKKRYGPYRLPSKVSADHDSAATKSIYSLPSPTFRRDRASSIFTAHSGSTGRGYVDLLDAHSSIRPSDFYGRVKATGTKNYGEDVADRNLGETLLDLGSTKADEPYAEDPSTVTIGEDEEDDQPRLPRQRHSMGSGLRAKSSNTDAYSPYPKRTSSRFHSQLTLSQNQERENDIRVAEKNGKAARRRSLPSYVSPSSSTDRPRSSSRVSRVKETDPNYFPDSLRERARAASQGGHERDVSSNSSSAKKSAQSSRKARDSASTVKDDIPDYVSHHARNESDQTQTLPDREDRPKSSRGSSRRRTISHMSSSHSVESSSRKHTVHNGQSSSRRSSISRSNLASAEPSSLRKTRDHSSSKADLESVPDLHDLFSLLPPVIPAKPSQRSLQKRPISRDQLTNHTQNSRVASPSIKSVKRLEIDDSIPELTSSLRHWSLTSETAGSTHSSNPFRPQSGHTTNTSVDLTPNIPLSKVIDSGQTSFTPKTNRVASKDRKESRDHASYSYRNGPPSPTRSSASSTCDEPFLDFSMDNNVLSDDSFEEPHPRQGEFEKDLIFADEGYGFSGSQLPGLPGLFDAAIPQRKPTRPRQSKSHNAFKGPFHVTAFQSSPEDAHPPVLVSKYSTRSLPLKSRHRPSRLRIPLSDSSESENDGGARLADSDSDEELSFDIPLTRSGPGRSNPPSSSRRRYQAAEEPIEEEADYDMDIKTVVRLHREAKERMRRSSAPARKFKGKGKAVATHRPRLGLDDPSSYADIES
ncbi:hypothetical protein F5B20DRAFT_49636 [Whalleya microplaca]|nr:hypothetical protein F5B20DRAFT_49636 [Whalleya microplaca]